MSPTNEFDSHNAEQERIERLIVRYLDGASTPDEADEVRALLLKSVAARAMLHSYQSIDDCARVALNSVLSKPMAAAVAVRTRRGSWLAAAAGVMAAAAAIGLFVFPYDAGRDAARSPSPVRPMLAADTGNRSKPIVPQWVVDEGLSSPQAWQQLAPHRDVWNVCRDCVSVFDPQTQRVYILDINRAEVRTTPVWYEH
ncbi:MAG: hypothetical protein HUU22_16900 [Phycisphaerae bacterium]|nr:hypothetical protein [Phycisphaerae bacterium]NUQ47700.1 hypothetical protein [Phycisphaerae bacterium]